MYYLISLTSQEASADLMALHLEPQFAQKQPSIHDLGGKGLGLYHMHAWGGINVPPALIITPQVISRLAQNPHLYQEIEPYISYWQDRHQKQARQRCDGTFIPLYSVRSGAAASMPGMMETFLNVGCVDELFSILCTLWGEQAASDVYYKFWQRFCRNIVQHEAIDDAWAVAKGDGLYCYQLVKEALKRLALDRDFDTLMGQIRETVLAVANSWNSPQAQHYRAAHHIDHSLGTAVIVQQMVFGHQHPQAATGVLFTRNPSNGDQELFGEYLMGAFGEDLVGGTVTPHSVQDLALKHSTLYAQLKHLACHLETQAQDMQDIEWTFDGHTLWVLQTRKAKRSGLAAFVCMVEKYFHISFETLIAYGRCNPNNPTVGVDCPSIYDATIVEKVIKNFTPHELQGLLQPLKWRLRADQAEISQGLGASHGLLSGRIVFSAADLEELKKTSALTESSHLDGDDETYIFVSPHTSPEDIYVMTQCDGILTVQGGRTSHAAVIARGMGKVCVVGAKNLVIQQQKNPSIQQDDHLLTIYTAALKAGDWITIDGTSGKIYIGKASPKSSHEAPEWVALQWLKTWINLLEKRMEECVEDGKEQDMHDYNIERHNPHQHHPIHNRQVSVAFNQSDLLQKSFRPIKVYANADTAEDAALALAKGARGIGLCRTEHMFFQPEKLRCLQKALLSHLLIDDKRAQHHWNVFERMQYEDFRDLLGACAQEVVTIRLMDPPLHEFLPSSQDDLNKLAEHLSVSPKDLGHLIGRCVEVNPMLGQRGCRLAITNTPLYIRQYKAIVAAAHETGHECVRVLVPFVMNVNEWLYIRRLLTSHVPHNTRHEWGVMVELPSLCYDIGQVSLQADFLSFGTNDLTQTFLGLSRDDTTHMIEQYIDHGLLSCNPFQTLHQPLLSFLQDTCRRAVAANPNIHISICGEHGQEESTFEALVGYVDSISCSPSTIELCRLWSLRHQ